MKKIAAFFSGLFFMVQSFAQIGGSSVYNFLDIPATARITAMGGNLITLKDNDPGQASDNPSLLNPSMDRTLVMSYNSYFAGINHGFVSYTYDKKLGTFNTAIKYSDYGKFREADAGNNELGSFSANELALIGGWGRAIDSSFSVGANVKLIYSNFYYNTSIGAAVDLSASYEIRPSYFLATLVFKNIGTQLKPYESGNKEPLPMDIQIGISKGFNKMPFRFSFIMQQLAKGNLTYPPLDDQSNTTLSDNAPKDNSQSTGANILRHFIIATEFTPTKSISLRFGYNFQRRKEMLYENRPGTVGFSWGFGIKISKFHFNYARSAYHLAGSPNHFTVLTRFDDWSKKSK